MMDFTCLAREGAVLRGHTTKNSHAHRQMAYGAGRDLDQISAHFWFTYLHHWEGGRLKDLARHLLLELHECDVQVLDDADRLQRIMVEAAARLRATILDVFCHRFQPQGVTVAVIITESHLTVHTWPEYGYAAVDVFTCGDTSGFHEIQEYLTTSLGSNRVVTFDHPRGPRVPESTYAAATAVGVGASRLEDLR